MKYHRHRPLDDTTPRATARLSALNPELISTQHPLFRTERFNRRLALGYLIVSIAWIFLSDLVLETWIASPALRANLQTIKGIGFVFVTAVLLLVILTRHYRTVRHIEKKIHARDNHIGRIIDAMANGVALIDLDGTIVDANPALAAILGHRREEIIGRLLAPARIANRERITPTAGILHLAQLNGQWSGDLLRQHSDGHTVPIHMTVAPLFDALGELTGYVADYIDLREINTAKAHFDGLGSVIEQLATETNLEILGEKALTAAVELTESDVGAVILIDDADGRLHHRWSRGIPDGENFLADTAPTLVGRIIADATPHLIDNLQEKPDQLPRFADVGVQRAIAVPVTVHGVTLGALVIGTTTPQRPFDDRQIPLFEALARQIAVALHRHDLLEEARRSEARFRNVVNTVPDILYTAEIPGFETRFISPSVEPIIGASPDDFLADTTLWRKLIHDEDLDQLNDALALSLKSHERYSVEYRSYNIDKSELFWFEDRGRIMRSPDGEPLAITGVVSDITARKKAEQRLAFLAFHDSLTGLPNRIGLIDQLNRHIESTPSPQGILLYCDLDRFHLVNDIHGHNSGDELLIETARRFQKILPAGATLSRIGADEFVTFIPLASTDPDHSPHSVAQHYALQIMASFREPFSIQDQRPYLSATIGIALLDPSVDSPRTLLKQAHRALAHAKETGPANFAFYAGELARRQQRRLSLQSRIHLGLDHDEFDLHYQPIVDLKSGAIVGAEALLRWQTSDGERISPGEFIPVAEESGLIIPLGDWVLQRACRDLGHWQQRGLNIKLSLNLSPRQFFHLDIVEKILQAVDDHRIQPHRLELELTESAMLVDPEQTAQILTRLQKAGFSVAIDDFGTGYSSLERLKQLPVQTLKIDRSFISQLPDDSRDASIVRSSVTLSENFSMASLAEGIETREQWNYLRSINCHLGQGFFFSPPLPANEFLARCQNPLPWLSPPSSVTNS